MSVAIVCMVNRTDASITEFNSSHINEDTYDDCEQFSGKGNSSNVADIHRVGK